VVVWCVVFVYATTGSVALQKCIQKEYSEAKNKLQLLLNGCRRVTVCLDGWTAKGLASSYLGISVCFFDPATSTPKHATLNLCILPHPHNGDAIAGALKCSLQQWNITAEKVMLVITDNGANVVKAVKLMQQHEKDQQQLKKITMTLTAVTDGSEEQAAPPERAEEAHDDSSSGSAAELSDTGAGSDSDSSADEEEGIDDEDTEGLDDNFDDFDLPENVPFRRMPCMAHTLQLIVKEAYKKRYAGIIGKARQLVAKIRKSSVAVEKLVTVCGKNVVSDCTTRWNSTFLMAKRLLEVKDSVNSVLGEMSMDTLLASEWTKLYEMSQLLESFAVHTDTLQTDTLSLSYIIPSLLDLQCHLQQFTAARDVTQAMLADFHTRFASLLNPDSFQFNPIPATACLLDPLVAKVILSRDFNQLLSSAKLYIITQVL
jgi:hypothetical protein